MNVHRWNATRRFAPILDDVPNGSTRPDPVGTHRWTVPLRDAVARAGGLPDQRRAHQPAGPHRGAFPPAAIVLLTVLLAWVVNRALFIGTGKPVPPPGGPGWAPPAGPMVDLRDAATAPSPTTTTWITCTMGTGTHPTTSTPNLNQSRIQPPSSRVQGPDALLLDCAVAAPHSPACTTTSTMRSPTATSSRSIPR